MSAEPVVRAERLTVRHRRALGCEAVDFAIPAGEIFVLLGRPGAGKTTILRCAGGELRASEGSMTIVGLDARKDRRRLRRAVRAIEPASDLARALAETAETRLFIADDLRIPTADAGRAIRAAAARAGSAAVLAATDDPDAASAIADRIGILRNGRVSIDAPLEDLHRRFRRLRYRNERTPTREDYGTELDDFEAVRVRVRGWGIEAIVSNATEARLEALRNRDGVVDVEISAMTLAEIFDAVAPAANA